MSDGMKALWGSLAGVATGLLLVFLLRAVVLAVT